MKKLKVKSKAKGKDKKPSDKPHIKGIAGSHDGKSYKDLKREAVIRGMAFQDVVESTHYGLIAYIESSNSKPDVSLIDKFDDWVDAQLELLGYDVNDAMRHPQLRLGFIGEKDDEGNIKKHKRIKGLTKPKKAKRERDDSGLYKGTKKSYTFELAKRGKTLEKTTLRVTKRYPDASPKSISIWHRAALRSLKKA